MEFFSQNEREKQWNRFSQTIETSTATTPVLRIFLYFFLFKRHEGPTYSESFEKLHLQFHQMWFFLFTLSPV